MEYFLARQPIFDPKMKVIGYELFSYDGFDNLIPMDTKEDQFTSKVITKSFLLVNTESLTGGKKAFIRFSRNLLVNEIATLLDKDLIAIELSDNIPPDEKVLAACQKFKDSGYLMVLDDFNFQFSQMPFLQFADMVKVDSGKTGSDVKKSVVERLKSKNIKSLMMNVESEEEFKEAVELGYDYFQGNFFRKPFIISGRDIPGYKLTYLQMLKEIHQPEIDFDKLEEIIKRDVSLTYKLLRLINSAAFGIMREIKSIKQALVLLGMREVKKWVALIALSDMGKEKPEELVKNALLRAKFCESLGPLIGLKQQSSDLFLLGMFSLIDAFIDQPFHVIMEDLPLAKEIKMAMVGGESPYTPAYDLTLTYEAGQWREVSKLAAKLNIDEKKLPEIYLASLDWVSEVLK